MSRASCSCELRLLLGWQQRVPIRALHTCSGPAHPMKCRAPSLTWQSCPALPSSAELARLCPKGPSSRALPVCHSLVAQVAVASQCSMAGLNKQSAAQDTKLPVTPPVQGMTVRVEKPSQRASGPLFFLYFRKFRKKHWPSLLRSVSSPVQSPAAPK